MKKSCLLILLVVHASHAILGDTFVCDTAEEKSDISWCYNTNPFRLPENLNYTLPADPVVSEFRCLASLDPKASCTVRFIITKMLINKLAESVEFIEVGEVASVFITTQDGGFVELEVPTELVNEIGYLGRNTLDLTSSWNIDQKLALKLLASKGSNLFYITGNLTQSSYLFQGNYSENFEIVQLQMWSNSSTEIRIAILLRDNMTDSYQIDFSVLNIISLAYSYQIDVTQSVHTWRILTQDSAWSHLSGFQIDVQNGDYNSHLGFQNSRSLVSLYNSVGVCIYQYEPTLVGDVTIPFGPWANEQPTWIFYRASDFPKNKTDQVVTVTGFSLAVENRTREFLQKTNPAALVHLVVAETSPELHSRTITLTDFANTQFWKNSYGNTTRGNTTFLESIINPVHKTITCSNTTMEGPNCTTVQTKRISLHNQDNPYNVSIQSRNVGNLPHIITFVSADKWVWVLGTVAVNESLNETATEIFNIFEAVGKVKKVAVSPNGMHVILLVTRYQYEMDSLSRYHDICSILADPNADETQKRYLQDYAELCDDVPSTRFPDLNDYVQHVSMCPSNFYCQSFLENKHSHLPPGYYVQNTFHMEICEPGYYCSDGVKTECPAGFVCPWSQMDMPLSCAVTQNGQIGNDATCAATKLQSVFLCPPGALCPSITFLPIPAPPGYKTQYNITELDTNDVIVSLIDCEYGEWCSLGRSDLDNNTLCPQASVCVDPAVVTPEQCQCRNQHCDYCPEGTYLEEKCPAGYYCKGPTAKVQCHHTQYCPPGSTEPGLCPGGHYCPDPSVKLQCPEGHYCHIGSVSPSKCPLFTICPAGTSKTQYNYGEVVVAFLLVTMGFLGRYIFVRLRDQRRKLIESFRSEDPIDAPKHRGPPCLSPARLTRASFYRIKDPQKRKQKALEIFGQALERDIKGLTFEFSDLGLKLKSGKQILEGVTGTIKPGRVTAVMGPSGAGKTTFLTTLSGKVPTGTITGRVLINGLPGDLSDYRHLVGYVPQEDIMLRMLTVKELLAFNASMRLPNSVSWEDRHDIVNAVIEILGLYDVRHSIIGDETKRGVSGGQRKRVNIGMELVSAPLVLFLDEPTSGLDATSSQEVCQALRTIASFGLTVVTVIHQPRYEIFSMFDDVLLLGKGGRTVYQGPTADTLSYFEGIGFQCPQHTNPADFFMDVLSGSVKREGHPGFTPSDLFDEWLAFSKNRRASVNIENHMEQFAVVTSDESDYDEETSEMEPWIKKKPVSLKPNRVPIYQEFFSFLVRTLVQQSRDLSSLMIDLALVCVAGAFLGLIFSRNSEYVGPPDPSVCEDIIVPTLRRKCRYPMSDATPSVDLMSCLSLALTATSASLRVFGTERVNYWREASSGLSTFAYFIAKDVGHIPNMVFFPLVFLTLFYSLMVPRAYFRDLYVLFLALQFAGNGVGYLVSILVKPQVSQMTGVTIILVMMMFSGTKPNLNQLKAMPFPMPYLPQISFLRWAMEGSYLAEVLRYEEVYNVDTGIDGLGYEKDNFSFDIGMIILLGVALRMIALMCMFLVNRDKKK